MTTSSWNLFERFQGFLHFQENIHTRTHFYWNNSWFEKKTIKRQLIIWKMIDLKTQNWLLEIFPFEKNRQLIHHWNKVLFAQSKYRYNFFLLKSLFSFTIDYLHLCSLFIASCECIHGILSMIFNRCVIHKPNQIKFTLH